MLVKATLALVRLLHVVRICVSIASVLLSPEKAACGTVLAILRRWVGGCVHIQCKHTDADTVFVQEKSAANPSG